MAFQHSPLHGRHLALAAKFAEFGGWEMPLEYPAGTLKEHAAVRERVGIFDVSHLGKVVVRGQGAEALVNCALTNDLKRLQGDPVADGGRAQYTLCCDDQTGGVVDDLIVYRLAEDHLLLVPNAANTAEVVRRLQAAAPPAVSITEHHTTHAVIAVQGPHADETLRAVGLPTGHPYMSFVFAELADGGAGAPGAGVDTLGLEQRVLVCRSGYTGERGYELIVANGAVERLWDALLGAGEAYDIQPCGLGARDTLRLEMGYPLHGNDLGPSLTPVMAGLGWAVGWDKARFWGREVLLAQRREGPEMRLRGLVSSGRGIPRKGMAVTLASDFPVGEITSGTFSPTLRRGVALALVNSQVAEGAEVGVDIRGRREVFTITSPPFVHSNVR